MRRGAEAMEGHKMSETYDTFLLLSRNGYHTFRHDWEMWMGG